MKVLCQKHTIRDLKKRARNIMLIGRLKDTTGKNCNGFHCKETPIWIIQYFGES